MNVLVNFVILFWCVSCIFFVICVFSVVCCFVESFFIFVVVCFFGVNWVTNFDGSDGGFEVILVVGIFMILILVSGFFVLIWVVVSVISVIIGKIFVFMIFFVICLLGLKFLC